MARRGEAVLGMARLALAWHGEAGCVEARQGPVGLGLALGGAGDCAAHPSRRGYTLNTEVHMTTRTQLLAPTEVEVLTVDPKTLRFLKTSPHEGWVQAVARGKAVILGVPDGVTEESMRSRINGALRSRHLKASVRRAIQPDGTMVFVVTKR